MVANDWKMDEFQDLLFQEVSKATIAEGLSEEEFEHIFEETFNKVLPEVEGMLAEDLAAREAEMLVDRRAIHAGFVERNFERWKAGFDKLERLIVMSEELGGAVTSALGKLAAEGNDPLFEATISLHSRAVLISREILCLMINGFPDGALGRWRTLHEISVVSRFISAHGVEVAERFLVHRHWRANERAKNYQRYSKRARLSPLDDETMKELAEYSHHVREVYGDEIASEFGWAYPALKMKRPKFVDVEKAVGLDHWRPRYKWASMAMHSTYQTPLEGLAMSEATKPARLVGSSNSGMVDPAQMTAITLNLATLSVVMLDPNLDRLAVLKIMLRLSDEIGEIFIEVQRKTLAEAQSAAVAKGDQNTL